MSIIPPQCTAPPCRLRLLSCEIATRGEIVTRRRVKKRAATRSSCFFAGVISVIIPGVLGVGSAGLSSGGAFSTGLGTENLQGEASEAMVGGGVRVPNFHSLNLKFQRHYLNRAAV